MCVRVLFDEHGTPSNVLFSHLGSHVLFFSAFRSCEYVNMQIRISPFVVIVFSSSFFLLFSSNTKTSDQLLPFLPPPFALSSTHSKHNCGAVIALSARCCRAPFSGGDAGVLKCSNQAFFLFVCLNCLSFAKYFFSLFFFFTPLFTQ